MFSDTPFGQDLKLCCCRHHIQRPFLLTIFHFTSVVAFAKKAHVSMEWLCARFCSAHHMHVSSVILSVCPARTSWDCGINGGMLGVLPNLRAFVGEALIVVSFKIVDVSNGLFLGVEYLVVELNGVVGLFPRLSKVVFHVVFGQFRFV